MQHRPKIENDLCNNGIEKYTLASFTAPQNIRIQKLNMHPEEQRGREVDTSNSCEDSMKKITRVHATHCDASKYDRSRFVQTVTPSPKADCRR